MMVDPEFLDVNSDLGAQYVAAMQLGGVYAYAGRDWMCERWRSCWAPVLEEVHNHHNFVSKEEHDGRWLWVCRTGEMPAFRGSVALWAGG